MGKEDEILQDFKSSNIPNVKKLADLVSLARSIKDERTRTRSAAAYLCNMAVRLLSMKRVLKNTGSIYLHCDPTMSHYLKLLMDFIFGKKNFRNEIIWHYGKWSNVSRHFQKNHDVIYFYSKSKIYTFNPFYITKRSEKSYHTNIVNNQGQLLIYDIKRVSDIVRDKYKEKGYKEVIVNRKGVLEHDVWTYVRDKRINFLNSQAKERLGYPTQKPLALLERIIKTSSNEDDLVLDPFCGCGTAVHAAEELNRRWIGIDISKFSTGLISERICNNFPLLKPGDIKIFNVLDNLESARNLARQDPFEFEKWACGEIGAHGMFREPGKKGSDGGVDGIIDF